MSHNVGINARFNGVYADIVRRSRMLRLRLQVFLTLVWSSPIPGMFTLLTALGIESSNYFGPGLFSRRNEGEQTSPLSQKPRPSDGSTYFSPGSLSRRHEGEGAGSPAFVFIRFDWHLATAVATTGEARSFFLAGTYVISQLGMYW